MTDENSILNPTIWIYNFEFREPVTTLTDGITALVCYIIFFQLRYYNSSPLHFRLMRTYFIVMAVGLTSASIFGHGLQAYVSPNWKTFGWIMGAIAIFFMESGTLLYVKKNISNLVFNFYRILIIGHLSLFLILMIFPETRNFNMVKINSSIGLIATILPLHFIHLIKSRSAASKWFVTAIIWGLIPGLVYNMEISLSRWFNYHDISHVLMAVHCSLLFLGVRLTTEQHIKT